MGGNHTTRYTRMGYILRKGVMGAWALCLLLSNAWARDFGVHGTLFIIEEENILEVIKRKLTLLEKRGALQHLTDTLHARMKAKMENPVRAPLYPRRTKRSSRLFDPSLTSERALRDHRGAIVVPAGTRLNPLDSMRWGEPLLLFDGTDPIQVAWAEARPGRWVLTQGNPFKVRKDPQRPVYVDQGGSIAKRFKITHLPVSIRQEGKQLLVEEGVE